MKKIHLMIAVVGAFSLTMQSCSKDEVKGCDDAKACNFNPEANKDDGSCTYAEDWYQDLNGDGLGNPYVVITDCNQPAGYVKGLCNPQTFWLDADGDGLGDPNNSIIACDSVAGYVSNSDDKIDEVPEVIQRAIMTYQGATWCGPCGSFGDPVKEHLETTYGDDMIILNCQSGDDISSGTSFGNKFGEKFANFFNPAIGSIPHAYFSAANYTMSEHGFSAAPTQFDNLVASILASTPTVGIIGNASIASGIVTVNTATKFVSASTQHFIGVYLLEDDVQASQTMDGGAPNEVTGHHNVMRAAAYTVGDLGIESMGISFVADQIVDGTYEITIPTTVVNNANLQVAIVVWNGNTADKISNAIILDID